MKTHRSDDSLNETEEDRFSMPDYFLMAGIGLIVVSALLAFDTILNIRTSQYPQYYLDPRRGSVVGFIRAFASNPLFKHAFGCFATGILASLIGLVIRIGRSRKKE